ncbi:MAG: LodA/GoxA family CTQ-dependent oxidase, partial [Solirubrobacteraceae bacterium]
VDLDVVAVLELVGADQGLRKPSPHLPQSAFVRPEELGVGLRRGAHVAPCVPDAQPSARRNDGFRGARRAGLFIVPGERTVRRAGARPVALDGGSFLGQPVSLGEAMTDGAGRLVILPGRGAAYRHGHPSLTSYAGNRRRRVRRPDPRDGASRAPAAGGRPRMGDHDTAELRPGNGDRLVTLYDAVGSMFVQSGALDAPPVSFARTSSRCSRACPTCSGGVSEGYLENGGFGSGHDWLAPATVERLADASPRAAAYRRWGH